MKLLSTTITWHNGHAHPLIHCFIIPLVLHAYSLIHCFIIPISPTCSLYNSLLHNTYQSYMLTIYSHKDAGRPKALKKMKFLSTTITLHNGHAHSLIHCFIILISPTCSQSTRTNMFEDRKHTRKLNFFQPQLHCIMDMLTL